jgi:16S rRNA (uracil1498-N3)-methyltransferase
VALAVDAHAGAHLLREAAALAYVQNLETPELGTDDAHHLLAVLRLRPGEIVIASDGAGSYRACHVEIAGGPPAHGRPAGASGQRRRPGGIVLVPNAEVTAVDRPVPSITVGFSLAKGDRTDWAVAKLAELGVDRIVPLLCDRTVARSAGAAALSKRTERFRRIAREASMQARRLWIPAVDEPLSFAEAPAELAALAEAPAGLAEAPAGLAAPAGERDTPVPLPCGVALAEPGGGTLSLATPVVLVGPEGGWSPAELGVGFPAVRLGDTILRVETAAVVAGALLSALRAAVVSAAGLTESRSPPVTFHYGE